MARRLIIRRVPRDTPTPIPTLAPAARLVDIEGLEEDEVSRLADCIDAVGGEALSVVDCTEDVDKGGVV